MLNENKPDVVVTFSLQDKKRTLISECLEEVSRLIYLEDVSENKRVSILKKAFIILSWNLHREINIAQLSSLKRARLLQLLSAGVDHLEFSLIPESLVIASNVGAYARPMAEHILGMILVLAKKLFINHRKMLDGQFDQQCLNKTLKDFVCGILGYGGIGREVARLMKAFGSKIYAINRGGITEDRLDFIGTLKNLDYVLKASDTIVVTIPLNSSTKGLIGKRQLEMMKKDAVFINVARGEIVDERALYEHLVKNPGFMAGLDVWWTEPFRHGKFRTNYPFLNLPNVVGSPHNSALIPDAIRQAMKEAAFNILKFLRGEPIKGIVRKEDYF